MTDYSNLTDEELAEEFDTKLRTMEWADENGEADLWTLTEGRLAEIDAEANRRGLELAGGA